MGGDSIKVAVRVRPFNSREKQRKATLIIGMSGGTTTIKNPADGKEKKYTFDHAYWSHDGAKELESGLYVKDSPESRYADQQMVFDDLGTKMLENAWDGYNASLFAYGQTGSGKSYSVVGYDANKGIIPILCDELFKGITDKGMDAQVSVSMLEIYNECVYDLLSGKRPKGGMKIRNHPKKGFYVPGQIITPVGSYKAIESQIDAGTKNRTIGATAMNATSSRAHTIVTIKFQQKIKGETGEDMTKEAIINLVDLAGSERAESTGATGDRLKEGAKINMSLTNLGNVMKALYEQSIAKGKKKINVPFRDSQLTMLLKNALCGNSKTIIAAALSPADINYNETLSTLMFADRAKALKTKATVNETPTEKLIRELHEENARLMAALKSGGIVVGDSSGSSGGGGGADPAAIEAAKQEAQEELDRQMSANEEAMRLMKESYEAKISREADLDKEEDAQRAAAEEKKKINAFLLNLNEDDALSGKISHLVATGVETSVGNSKAEPAPEIALKGMGILKEHCVFNFQGGINLTLRLACEGAQVRHNGKSLETMDPVLLHHLDRLQLGPTQLYTIVHPVERDAAIAAGNTPQFPSYEDAHHEISVAAGLVNSDDDGHTVAQKVIQADLVAIVPHVNEANGISQALDKKVYFEAVLVAERDPDGTGRGSIVSTQIQIQCHDLIREVSWMWPRSNFLNRKYLMQEMYELHADGDAGWDRAKEDDPFFQAIQHQPLGTAFLYLSSLGHMIDLEEDLGLSDEMGTEVGRVFCKVDLCDSQGAVLDEDTAEDLFVEEPDELIGKPANFLLTITACRGVSRKCSSEVFATFRVMGGAEEKTKVLDGMNPEWNHQHHIKIPKVTRKDINYFMGKAIKITVHSKRIPVSELKSGKDGASWADPRKPQTTEELMNAFRTNGNTFGGPPVGSTGPGQMASMTGVGGTDHDNAVHGVMRGSERTSLQVVGHDEGTAMHAEAERMRQEASHLRRQLAMASRKVERVMTLIKEANREKHRVIPVHDLEDAFKTRSHRFKAVGDDILLAYKAKALKTHLRRVSATGAADEAADGDGERRESAACLVM